MSFGESWSYTDSTNWKKAGFTQAGGQQQSPINIDTAKTSDCNLLCQIAMKYSKSKCYARVMNRTPIITFDSGSFIKFTKTKEILALKQMTIHTPSLHTINGVQYDMEVVLYHKLTGTLNSKDPNFMPGGTAISILFQKGVDYGKQNTFFNSFINQLPVDTASSSSKEIDIPVGESWGPELIIPELKSYYFYPGSLPFPPCEENWKWIVFDEIQNISSNIIDTLGIAFNDNVRPTMRLNGRVPAYNSSVDMKTDNELDKKVSAELALLAQPAPTQSIAGDITPNNNAPGGASMLMADKVKKADWYKSRKLWIKGIIISLCILLTLFGALRMVKYIISEDILNKIMVRQALGSSKNTNKASSSNNSASSSQSSVNNSAQSGTNMNMNTNMNN